MDRLDESERRDRYRAVGLRHGPALHFILRTFRAEKPEDLAVLRATLKESGQIAREFDHPNLCVHVDDGATEEGAFTVANAIAGKTLERVLEELRARGMRLPVPVALYIAHQLCAALSFAHTLADRSGKPYNLTMATLAPSSLLIGYEGDVRIIDGLPLPAGKVAVDLPGVEAPYVSPERARGDIPDPRSDIYSVGLILYEILTLRAPFRRPTPAESRAAVLMGTLLNPSELNPGLERRVDALVMRALHRDPEQRFPDAWDMEESLLELSGAVELRRSRGVLAGVLNTIFGESREVERQALRSAIDALERSGRFSRSAPPASSRPDPPEAETPETPPNRATAARPPEPPPKPRVVGSLATPAGNPEPPPAPAEAPRRISAHGESPAPPRVTSHDEPTVPARRVTAHGDAPRRVSAHGEPSRPAPITRWTNAVPWVAAALLLVLIVAFLQTRGAGDARSEGGAGAPGQALIDQLRGAYPDAAPPEPEALSRAWAALLNDTPEARASARATFERAAAAAPDNVSALAGLALVLAHPEAGARGLDAAALLNRAEAIRTDAPETRHARVGMLLDAKDAAKALEAARACLAEFAGDPRCGWYEGLALRATGRGAEALDALRKAAAGLPKEAGVALQMGDTARELGEYALARRTLEEALRATPESPQLNLALCRLDQQAGSFEAAKKRCSAALAGAPDSVAGRLQVGALLLQALDQPAEAAEILLGLAKDPAIADSPLRTEILVRASWAAVAAGRGAEALPHARAARERAPDSPAAALALALALDATGDAEGAEELIRGASFDGPDARALARLRWHAARLYVAHGRERFALPLLQEALGQDPGWVPAQLLLAEVLWRTGDADGALRAFEALARAELGPDGRDPMGLAPPVKPDAAWLEEAVAARSRDHKDGPTLRAAGVLLAQRCLSGGDCGEARARLRDALRQSPDDLAATLLLTRLMLRDGLPDDALGLIGPLAPKAQENPEIAMTLALAYAAAGRAAEADAAFSAALAKSPPGVWHRLHAAALLARGDLEGARAAARRALALQPGDMPSVAILSQ